MVRHGVEVIAVADQEHIDALDLHHGEISVHRASRGQHGTQPPEVLPTVIR
jgi:hypothetical protein